MWSHHKMVSTPFVVSSTQSGIQLINQILLLDQNWQKKGGMVHQSTENWTNFVRQERLKEEREWFGDGQSLHICPHLATSRSSSDSTRSQPSQAHSSSTSSSQGLAKRKTYLWYRIKENMEGYIWRSFFKTPNNLLSITPTNRTSMGRVLMFFKACRSSWWRGFLKQEAHESLKNTEAPAVHWAPCGRGFRDWRGWGRVQKAPQ